MNTNVNLTTEELKNLNLELQYAKELIENSPINKRDFLSNPFGFLKAKFSITLLNSIAKSKQLISDFNRAVKDVFKKLKDIFGDCFACKMAALIIIFSLLAKGGALVLHMLDFIDKIVESIETLFEGTSQNANSFLAWIKESANEIKPSTLALRICQDLGKCEPILPNEMRVNTHTDRSGMGGNLIPA